MIQYLVEFYVDGDMKHNLQLEEQIIEGEEETEEMEKSKMSKTKCCQRPLIFISVGTVDI